MGSLANGQRVGKSSHCHWPAVGGSLVAGAGAEAKGEVVVAPPGPCAAAASRQVFQC